MIIKDHDEDLCIRVGSRITWIDGDLCDLYQTGWSRYGVPESGPLDPTFYIDMVLPTQLLQGENK